MKLPYKIYEYLIRRVICSEKLLIIVFLPLLLFLLTYFILGCYFETNDDAIITFFLQGLLIDPGLQDLTLYFHGFSSVLGKLYHQYPEVPWYGLFNYFWLYISTVLAFYIIFKAFKGNFPKILFFIIIFYLSTWLEHVTYFNFIRVPFLLTGTGFLINLIPDLPHKKRWLVISGLLFMVALAIRPSAAILGLIIVGPVTFFFNRDFKFTFLQLGPVLVYIFIAAIFFTFLEFFQSPAEKNYRRLDWLKSTVVDFRTYKFEPRNERDTFAMEAVRNWLLADAKVVNENFFKNAGRIDYQYILQEIAPDKFYSIRIVLVRDHFMVLILNLILIGILLKATQFQRSFLLFLSLYQIYFWGIVLAVGIFLKLPLRVITSCLSLYTLVHLVLLAYFQNRFKLKLIWWGLAIILPLQLYKIGHRSFFSNNNQKANELYLSFIGKTFHNKIIVTADLYDIMSELSPFRNYTLGQNKFFPLSGWITLQPGLYRHYKSLTGHENYVEAVMSLSENKNTLWLSTPYFINILNQHFTYFYNHPLLLEPTTYGKDKNFPLTFYKPHPENIKK